MNKVYGKRRIKWLRNFYMATRKHNRRYYNKGTFTSIRAAIDRHLCNEPDNKPFSLQKLWLSGPNVLSIQIVDLNGLFK